MFLVDGADSSGAAASEGTVEIVHDKADVMDAGPTFGDELADRRIGLFGFEQLDEGFTGREAGDPGTICIVEIDLGHAEQIAVEWKDLVECAHGDPDVGDARGAAGCVGHVSALVRKTAGAEF